LLCNVIRKEGWDERRRREEREGGATHSDLTDLLKSSPVLVKCAVVGAAL